MTSNAMTRMIRQGKTNIRLWWLVGGWLDGWRSPVTLFELTTSFLLRRRRPCCQKKNRHMDAIRDTASVTRVRDLIHVS